MSHQHRQGEGMRDHGPPLLGELPEAPLQGPKKEVVDGGDKGIVCCASHSKGRLWP